MSFNFIAAITICSDFGAPQNKSDTISTVSPSISHEVMGPNAMIFVLGILSFKPTFSLSTFTFIKRLFSSSSLSAVRVVSSAYLRLLIFLPTILIPACVYSSPAFLMMYSAYKLNKQGEYTALTYSFSYLKPVCCSMSSSNCCFRRANSISTPNALTVANTYHYGEYCRSEVPPLHSSWEKLALSPETILV